MPGLSGLGWILGYQSNLPSIFHIYVTLIECAAKKLQYLIIEGENPVMA
jgi:hypothetical protein